MQVSLSELERLGSALKNQKLILLAKPYPAWLTETLNDFYPGTWHIEIMPKLSKVTGF